MSLLKRRWSLHKRDDRLAADIASKFRISKPTAQILINRGISLNDEIERFLAPKLSFLRDPFEIPDMHKAVERTLSAVRNKEKVFVWGDYDADGVTGSSIVVLGLKKAGIEAGCYIPHRYDEGYGLNIEGLKKIASLGATLIITVDCGISNFKEIQFAKTLGIDVIVTDHHNIPEVLPPAVACVDPKMMDKDHPSRDLAGAGVAFKFVWALLRSAGFKESSEIKEFLDLVALGTIADVVPLTGENRILAVSGISLLNEKRRAGVKHLFSSAKLSGDITARNISFMLAPRLNAPGRLKHAELSLNLLLEDDPQKAKSIADEINLVNSQRQQIGALIGEDVFSRITDPENTKLIVLSGKNWHPGVIGIVASRISEKYNRPSILISDSGKVCRGSARSIEGFDVYKLLLSCKDIFSDFGGHKDAAGFEMLSGSIEELKSRLSTEIEGSFTYDELVPKTRIDVEAEPEELSCGLAREIERLAPFGQGNPSPVFLSKNMKVDSCKKVGAKGSHIKLKLSRGGAVIDAIGFGLGALAEEMPRNSAVDIAFNLSVNEWDGFVIPQAQLVDIRRAQK
jgi:single-stranded-DNA-specific exonuclease